MMHDSECGSFADGTCDCLPATENCIDGVELTANLQCALSEMDLRAERAGLQARIKFTADHETLKYTLNELKAYLAKLKGQMEQTATEWDKYNYDVQVQATRGWVSELERLIVFGPTRAGRSLESSRG